MALIKCSKCGGLLSDKATKCPHCGCSIEEIKGSEPKVTVGVEVSNEEQKENASHKVTTEGNSKTALIIFIIAILALSIACIIGSQKNQSKASDLILDPDSFACEVAKATEVLEDSDVAEAAPVSQANINSNKHSYEFVVNGMTLRLTFDKSEETAKLEVDGHTFYGTCEHDGLYRENQIQVTGFDGADNYDINKGSSSCSWRIYGPWIDYKNNYLYITADAAKSLNPVIE